MTQQIFSKNFQLVPRQEAMVSVMDRGFLYGDSVYEVVRNYDHSDPFLLKDHYDRLTRSAGRIGLQIPFTLEKISTHIKECLSKIQVPNAYVRFIVTGGIDNDFHLGFRDSTPQTLVIATELKAFPERYYTQGLKMSISSVLRNHRKALDPNIKSGNYLNNILAAQEARVQNHDDTILVNLEGNVTEASNSNVFMVKSGVVLTPNEESGLLEGISRKFLLQILQKNNIPHRIASIPLPDFLSADEIFVTSTLKEVIPVSTVDGKPVGPGTPGPMTLKLMEAFRKERIQWLQRNA